jgi:AmmeMemoRadiSam system protein B
MKLQPVVAGQFYPDEPQELRRELDSFAREKAPVLEGPVAALLLPHAGYVYSGDVAALGYRSLPERPKTIIVAGPSHYLSFKGVSVFSGGSIATPLGDLAVDQEACRFLMEFDPRIMDFPPAFAKEHSAEVHFPMIKQYCPDTRVLPIVMGQGMESSVRPLVEGLLALRKKKSFLLVASSDLSHYPDYKTAVEADRRFLEALLSGDEGIVDRADKKIMAQRHKEYYCTHCGKEPVSALLRFTRGIGADKIKLLAYKNSGDVTGDHSRVVGYSAVAFSE